MVWQNLEFVVFKAQNMVNFVLKIPYIHSSIHHLYLLPGCRKAMAWLHPGQVNSIYVHVQLQ